MENHKPDTKNIKTRNRRKKRIETVATILLSAATILSAWCVYESSQWGGEQYFRIEDENMADRKRLQKEISSHQRLAADAQVFLQYVGAKTSGNDELAEFLLDRFPPHLMKAALAWKALDPLHNKAAPVSPMHMKEYVLPEEADIAKFTEEARKFKIEANKCDNHADNYMLLSLVLSMVLFFCGISGVTESETNQMILIGFALAIFIVVVYYVIKYPVLF